MRGRRLLPLALVACLAAAAGSAGAAGPTPVLDGRQVRLLTQTYDSPNQTQLPDAATGARALDCERPRCVRLPFVYFPAKGVNSALELLVTWNSPLTDVDLYLTEMDPIRGNLPAAACASKAGGTSEKLFFPAGFLRRGTSYALLADIQHTTGDRIVARAAMPGRDETPRTVPSSLDRTVAVNCGH